MELQFHKTPLQGLQLVKREVRNLEQTQELRLPDGMPDIGRVLGAWGQVLLRSKEWRSGSAVVSGGVQTWVLYQPEGGGNVQCVQLWIPFQAKWELPDSVSEGTISAICHLRSADARSAASRKMMVRVNVGVLGELWAPAESSLYTPDQLPEDICLLRRIHSVRIPRETGEKPFTLEEELTLPASAPKLEKLLHYKLQPELIEKKILSDKAVFRGAGLLHILYLGEDGNLHTWDFELPFSQYAELEREYEAGTTVRISPAVTSLEAEMDLEGRLQMKAGLTGQYMICQQQELEVVEDAYSPLRTVSVQTDTVELPLIMAEEQMLLTAEQTFQANGSAVDQMFLPDHPYVQPSAEGTDLGIPGQFQLLYTDENGQLQTSAARWEGKWIAGEEDADANVLPMAWASGRLQTTFDGNGLMVSAEVLADALVLSRQGIPVVTGLEMGEAAEPDPNRPSLILCRAGGKDLWALAKTHGSTVEQIMEANKLEEEPAPNQMLLIPVV